MAYLLSCRVCVFSACSQFASLFISTDSCFCLSCFSAWLLKNTRQPLKDEVMDEFLLSWWHIYHWHHLWYLYVAALLSSFPVVTVSLFFFVSYLHPPLLLLAGRLGADKFGREQAKGGQTRSLCVYIEGTERCWGGGDVATTDTVQLRPGGGLWQKIKYCAFVLWSCDINRWWFLCQGVVNSLRMHGRHLWVSAVINGYMWACAAKNS